MAFCVRSERKMDYFKTDQLNIGPGQYFQSTDKNYIKKRIRPPFQLSSQRSDFIKTNDNPGPGSYDLIDKKETTYNTSNINNVSSILFNSVHNNSIISKKTRNKNNSNILSENNTEHFINIFDNNTNNNSFINNKKIGFLSQVIRFDNNNSKSLEKNNEPGPGTYDFLNTIKNNTISYNILKNQEKNKKNKKLMNHSLSLETGSLKRIISIPSKDMNGYIINEQNKSLNLVIDRTSNLGKKESTNEYIGPGRYDINLNNKVKGILEWSKGFNLKEINNKKIIKNRKITLEEMKKKGDMLLNYPSLNKKYFFSKLYTNNNYNLIQGKCKKGLNDLNTKLFANNILTKNNNLFIASRDSFISENNEVPGPGYYTRNIEDKKKLKKTYEGGFGSSCNRFLYKSKSMQDLGPTTYFVEKNKFQPDKKLDLINHLKNNKISDSIVHNTSYFEENNKNFKLPNPGPGTYELSQSFINKTFGKYTLMDNTLIRFKPKINENPGPGTYTKDFNFNENDNNIRKKIKKIITIKNKEEEEKKKKVLEDMKKKKLEIPGVGSYNNDFFESMNYKIKTKFNPKISYNSPFLMSSHRFKYQYDKVDSYTYEPFYYDKSIKNKQYMVFGKAKRFNKDNENKNKNLESVGPGSYNLDKNIWNKKTYNRLFS